MLREWWLICASPVEMNQKNLACQSIVFCFYSEIIAWLGFCFYIEIDGDFCEKEGHGEVAREGIVALRNELGRLQAGKSLISPLPASYQREGEL
jgi:hypothetical protein